MNCNYKVNIKDIQNKYKFNIFAMGGYNDSDLRKMIESVFYALPRVNGSGTNVTLNDTAFSYMKNKLNATDTSQYTTTGKNLFNGNAVSTTTPANWSLSFENNVLTIEHKNTYSTGTPILDLGVLPSGTYVISGTLGLNISLYKNGTWSSSLTNGSTFSCNGIDNITFSFSNGNATTITYTNVQLELGSTPTDYEPYTNGASPNPDYPQVIHTITGDNEVVVCGKNLLDLSTLQQGIYQPSASPQLDNTSDTRYRAFALSLKAGTHTINFDKSCLIVRDFTSYDYSGNTTLGNFSGNAITSATFTMTQNGIAYFGFRKDSGNWDNNNDLVWLTSGNEATTYEPYQSNSVLLTLGDKEICKIGNYEDKIFKAIKGNEVYDSLASEEKATLDYGKWYLRKNIGKIDLGTLNYSKEAHQIFGDYFWATISNVKYQGVYTSTTYASLCSSYIPSPRYNTYFINNRYCFDGAGTNVSQIQIKNSDYSDASSFKTSLNGVMLYVPLNTPTNELFNDTIQDQLEDIYNNMLSYEGQTNVSQVNEDLPFNINSTAIKDLNNL